MKRSVSAASALAVLVLVAGCGSTASNRGPSLARVPLISGTQVVTHVRRCDRGVNPYCAIQLVVTGAGYPSSDALLDAEKAHLHSLHWTMSQTDNGNERAADSPGQHLRLIYATAELDLQALDLGWIQRSPAIGHSLSNVMFDRRPALSLMLETGAS